MILLLHDAPHLAESADLYLACGSSDTAVQHTAYSTLWRYLYRVAHFMLAQQPDQDALAQDCAQRALIRIHTRYTDCTDPLTFRAWSRRIVSNLVIDELRRRQRLNTIPLEQAEPHATAVTTPTESHVLNQLTEQSLRQLLLQAPISDRSRRVIIGRYLDDLPDEVLAQQESALSQTEVLPSHIQVTRAKNIAKLREWGRMRDEL